MLVSFAFIIIEWCTQSHMATHNHAEAIRGLARTRTFKWLVSPFSGLKDFTITKSKVLFGKKRKSLVWRKKEEVRQMTVITGSKLKQSDKVLEETCQNIGPEKGEDLRKIPTWI